MPLADFFSRNALAAAQVLRGQDAESLSEALNRHVIAVAWGTAAMTREGRALIELLVRLLARLYPRLRLDADGETSQAFAGEMASLARAINPNIEINGGMPTITVAVGLGSPDAGGDVRMFAGSDAWDAFVGTSGPRATGSSENPCGAGAAASLAAANVFRAVFASVPELDDDGVLSTLDRVPRPTENGPTIDGLSFDAAAVLVGCGGIGNSAAWALARVPVRGRLHLVDHDAFDLGNLQRTVLATRVDEGRSKVEVLTAAFTERLTAVPHRLRFAEFCAAEGYGWDRVLVALDTAADRRAVQASLPRWIANSWTQLGDLGLGIHVFDDPDGPCLYCAYLPDGVAKNRDELVAAELGIPDRLAQVRDLLYRDAPPPSDLLDAVATARGIARDLLAPYAARPLRLLYVEGVCGGGVVSLATLGQTPQELHVPLAHQSALAGVLLAAAFLADVAGVAQSPTVEARLDVMHALDQHMARPVRRSTRGCICLDPDYKARYHGKWRS